MENGVRAESLNGRRYGTTGVRATDFHACVVEKRASTTTFFLSVGREYMLRDQIACCQPKQ